MLRTFGKLFLRGAFLAFVIGIAIFAFQQIVNVTSGGASSQTTSVSNRKRWAGWSEGEDIPNADIIVSREMKSVRDNYLTTSGNIYGQLANNTGKRLSYVQITFGIYTTSGAKISDCLDNVSGLDVGGVWNYKALCFDLPNSEFSYKIDDITYF